VRLLGPAEAPFAVLRGRHRFRLLAQSQTAGKLHDWLRAWLAKAPKERGSIGVAVDVDPMSFCEAIPLRSFGSPSDKKCQTLAKGKLAIFCCSKPSSYIIGAVKLF